MEDPTSEGTSLVLSESEVQQQEQTLRAQCEQQMGFVQKAWQSVQFLKTQIKSLECRLSEEEQRRHDVERERDSVRHELSDLRISHDQLAVVTTELKSEVADLQDQLNRSQGDLLVEIERLNGLVQQLQTTVDKQQKQIESLSHFKMSTLSFTLGHEILMEPSHAMMLPNGNIIVTDVKKGIATFNTDCELQGYLQPDDWKWPQAMVYDVAQDRVIVSVVRMARNLEEAESVGWYRAIIVFDQDLQQIEFYEGPKHTGFESHARENLAMCHTYSDVYMSLADSGGSGIWKRRMIKDANWREVAKRAGAHFSDFQVTPTAGALTELLVVETRMGYVHRWQVQQSGDVLGKYNFVPTPKPGSIAVDEKGVVFLHDVESNKLLLLDSISCMPRAELGVVNSPVTSMTAQLGWLAVVSKEDKRVLMYKYSHLTNDGSKYANEIF